jgi:hypothetical protein
MMMITYFMRMFIVFNSGRKDPDDPGGPKNLWIMKTISLPYKVIRKTISLPYKVKLCCSVTDLDPDP